MSGFRLAGLLRLRQSQQDVAAAELARANAERESARRRREETEEMLNGTSFPDRADERAWALAVASRAALGALVAEHTLAVAAATARAAGAGRTWSAARTRTTTLEKLADRHAVEERAEEQRVEQIALDETATRRATTGHDPGPAALGTAAHITPEGER